DPKADIEQDIKAVKDEGEPTSVMEPLLVGETARRRAGLTDLALQLAQRSAGFRRSLPSSLLTSLADLVRTMNCYYSNLIEGHATHPIEIERALNNDYSSDAKRRDLQLEATAHIAVQKWIDGGAVQRHAVDVDFIREIHRRFCELLPPELLLIEDPKTGEKFEMVPGALRTRDVAVNQQVGINPRPVPRSLIRSQDAYVGLSYAATTI